MSSARRYITEDEQRSQRAGESGEVDRQTKNSAPKGLNGGGASPPLAPLALASVYGIALSKSPNYTIPVKNTPQLREVLRYPASSGVFLQRGKIPEKPTCFQKQSLSNHHRLFVEIKATELTETNLCSARVNIFEPQSRAVSRITPFIHQVISQDHGLHQPSDHEPPSCTVATRAENAKKKNLKTKDTKASTDLGQLMLTLYTHDPPLQMCITKGHSLC
ncbi:hypothetical protein CEXT_238991 [Caerostris extrusa]|uniref:Uncharacterized protein n=1 Tax=Caerostris extrusa TaxID=172846 RepID=A0AAV4R9W9_CAEEX|nr:hypothetical protein CEXT_238991 [Caerostris extrusa]